MRQRGGSPGGGQRTRGAVVMSGPIDTASLACATCGALVDEGQAWQPISQCWLVPSDANGIQGARPLAWRPLPRLPEWTQ